MSALILDFIAIFQRIPQNIELFTECACYYFAIILKERFPFSTLVYNPHKVHFAVRVSSNLYDITGIISEDVEDYMEWEEFEEKYKDDADLVLDTCMRIKGGDVR